MSEERDLVSRLRWPGISGPDDHPVSVKLRVEAADEIERLRRRVVVLEMVIQEELDEFDCCDDANRMIVESIHERGASVGPSEHRGASGDK